MQKNWIRITTAFEHRRENEIEIILASIEHCGSEIVEEEDRVVYHVYTDGHSHSSVISSLRNAGFVCEVTEIADADWMELWKKEWKPFEVGETFVIVPSWEPCGTFKNRRIIRIDPGMAFGTGKHETTSSCIELMEKHIKRGGNFLDIGTGSGILSIAASLSGCNEIVLFDNDPETIGTTRRNITMNNCSALLFCGVIGSLSSQARFSTVAVNIIWEVIRDMFCDIFNHTEAGGIILLSGILFEKRDEVLSVLSRHKLNILEELHKNEWYSVAVMK